MNTAIIGCGLIGQKRAQNLAGGRLLACVDKVAERAQQLASRYPDSVAFTDWRSVMTREDIHIIIICTLHSSLAEIALAAVEAGKHVLIEKPGARRSRELEPIIATAKKNGVLV